MWQGNIPTCRGIGTEEPLLLHPLQNCFQERQERNLVRVLRRENNEASSDAREVQGILLWRKLSVEALSPPRQGIKDKIEKSSNVGSMKIKRTISLALAEGVISWS